MRTCTYLDLGCRLALKRRGPKQDKLFVPAGDAAFLANHDGGAGVAAAAAPAALHQPGLHGRVEVLRDGEIVAVVPHPKRRDLPPHHLLVGTYSRKIYTHG